jgi:hypothetical protein
VNRHGAEYWFYQHARGTRHAGPRIALGRGTTEPEFWRRLQAAKGEAKTLRPATQEEVDHFIYFIECGAYIKIGFASSLKARLSSLATATPYPLKVLAAIKGDQQTERSLHDRFAAAFHRGEWFRKTPELLTFINRLSARGDIEVAESAARAPPWDGSLRTYRSIYDAEPEA